MHVLSCQGQGPGLSVFLRLLFPIRRQRGDLPGDQPCYAEDMTYLELPIDKAHTINYRISMLTLTILKNTIHFKVKEVLEAVIRKDRRGVKPQHLPGLLCF